MKDLLIYSVTAGAVLLLCGAIIYATRKPKEEEEDLIAPVRFEGLEMSSIDENREIEIRMDPNGNAELRINGESIYTTNSSVWVQFWVKK